MDSQFSLMDVQILHVITMTSLLSDLVEPLHIIHGPQRGLQTSDGKAFGRNLIVLMF